MRPEERAARPDYYISDEIAKKLGAGLRLLASHRYRSPNLVTGYCLDLFDLGRFGKLTEDRYIAEDSSIAAKDSALVGRSRHCCLTCVEV